MSLYVKLDTSYADDEKVILAGEKAEVLYVRSLCLAKRILSDGFIADAHLPRFGLTGHAARAKRLCDVGLWRRDGVAGGYWIVSWLKHNPSAREVDRKRSKASEDGALGNHRRWHVDEGQPSEDCDFCRSEGRVGNGDREPSPDQQPDSGTGSGTRSPETESETESESKKSDPDVSDVARELCNAFVVDHCRPNGHGEPSKGSRSWRDWLVEMDRLVRIGPPNVGQGVSPIRIREVISAMAEDKGSGEFPGWSAVCESVPTFRKKFSKIAAAVDAKKRGSEHNGMSRLANGQEIPL